MVSRLDGDELRKIFAALDGTDTRAYIAHPAVNDLCLQGSGGTANVLSLRRDGGAQQSGQGWMTRLRGLTCFWSLWFFDNRIG